MELLYSHLVLFGNSCVAVSISVKLGKMMGIQAKISSLLGSGSILWFSGVKWFPAPESLPVSKVNCSVKLQIFGCIFPTKTRWLILLQDGLHASFENSQHASRPGSNGVILQSAVLPGGTFVEEGGERGSGRRQLSAVKCQADFSDSLALLIDGCLLLQLPKANWGFRSIAYY